jgi:DNA (cytosine-5)-methyltransferase 1
MRNGYVLSKHPGKAFPISDSARRRALVLVGGFPCQGLSVAGPTRKLVGASELWYEFRRIIYESAPGWVVVENVGHTWRKWVPEVRRDLWLLGYASVPLRVRASDLGACHERSRVFIVANPDRKFIREFARWWSGQGRQGAEEFKQSWDSTPRRLGTDDGVPDWVDRRHALGNAAVPHIASLIARGIKAVSTAQCAYCGETLVIGGWSASHIKECESENRSEHYRLGGPGEL